MIFHQMIFHQTGDVPGPRLGSQNSQHHERRGRPPVSKGPISSEHGSDFYGKT